MKKLAIVFGAAVSLALAVPALAQAQTVIKFSHVVAPDTPKGKGSLKFKELAEKYTNGKVKVEVYPNSQLYKDNEELQALQLGAVQMLAPSLAKFGPLGVKEFEVFDLPYILPDKAALRKVTEGALGKKLMGMLEPKGITGLAYWDNGFKDMSANKKLLMPADFRGLKMRIQSSKVLEAQMRALGAIPQVMAFSEVYQALRPAWSTARKTRRRTIYTQKMHEVQKYTTRSGHGYIGYAVITNKKFWDGLPADVRASAREGDGRGDRHSPTASRSRTTTTRSTEMKKSGKTEMVELTAEQKAAWRKALEPVYTEMEGRVGKEMLAEFKKEAGGGATH